MNKNDLKLIIIVIIVISLLLLITHFTKKEGEVLEVYYEDELILSKDLNIDSEYTVDGLLGKVVIEVKNKKVRVKEENSPKHICSKEGYISDSSKPLICLPNKIIIKIVANDKKDIDGVVY